MHRIIFFLILLATYFLIIVDPVESAIVGQVVNLTLSYDNGSSWTIEKSQTYQCGIRDTTKYYGSSAQDWEHEWTTEELNNDNFMVNMIYAQDTGAGSQAWMDHLELKVYYELPAPNITFIDLTPSNNEKINSTLIVNISSDNAVAIINASLEENSTGAWLNHSMWSYNETVFYYILAGEEGVNDGIFYSFRVYANGEYAQSITEIRNISVGSDNSTLTLNRLDNDTSVNLGNAILNVTIYDPDDDLMDLFIYGSNNTNYLSDSLIYSQRYIPSGNYTYNWTALPLIYNNENDFLRLYHLNNLGRYGEDAKKVYDSTNHQNGSVYSGLYVNSGYFGGGFYLDGDEDYIIIGNGSQMTDLCFNGCSLSAWIKPSIGDVEGTLNYPIVGRYDLNNWDAYVTVGMIRGSGGNNYTNIQIFWDGRNTVLGGKVCTASGYTQNYIYPDTWHHVVGTFNTTHAFIYTDGELKDPTKCTFELNETAWLDNTEDFRIGAFDYTPFAYYKGSIDEVAVWNRTLTSQEILEMYQMGNGTYYWNVSVQDARNQFNESELRIFHIPAVITCNIDCTGDYTISELLDCQNDNLTISGVGNLFVNANITNINRIVGKECKIIVKNGLSLS